MAFTLKSSLCMIVTVSLVAINAEMLQGPSSTVTFRGVNSTFTCQGVGSVIWYINGTSYDFKSRSSFTQRGISINEAFLQDNKIVSSVVTIETDSVINNNTELFCAMSGLNSTGVSVSDTVDLIILDLSTPMLVLSESNPNEFEVTWQKVYAPSDHMIRTYNVSVSDEKGRTLAQESISADSENDTYSYLYLSEQSRLEYPSCSKLVFSVVAIGEDGRSSESADVSWDENVKKSSCLENNTCPLLGWDIISGASCLLQYDYDSVQVSFNTPRLCQFQYVGYELTLTQEGRDIEVLRQVTGTFSGSDNSNAKATNLTGVKLDDDKFYSAIINVKVDGRELPRKTTNCIADIPPTPEGLENSSSDLGGLTPFQIAIVSLCAVGAFAMLIVNAVAIICIFNKRR